MKAKNCYNLSEEIKAKICYNFSQEMKAKNCCKKKNVKPSTF